jgi:hypothetical protein
MQHDKHGRHSTDPTPECGKHPDFVFVFLQRVYIFEWLCLGIQFESLNEMPFNTYGVSSEGQNL